MKITRNIYKYILLFFIVFNLTTLILFICFDVNKEVFPVSFSSVLWYIYMALIVISATILIKVRHKIADFFNKLDSKSIYIVITLSIIIRVFWINSVAIATRSDFLTYHILADALANGKIKLESYIALFPHVLGYPLILSVFYRIFGSYVFVAQYLNVFFYAISIGLIYKISTKIWTKGVGIFVATVIAFWPSHIFYTSLVCTETIFIMLMLTIVWIFVSLNNKSRNNKILLFASLGVLIAIVNSIRPIGLILIASIIIYELFFGVKIYKNKIYIANFFALCVAFVLGCQLYSHCISSVIKREMANSPIGFNAYVGLNKNAQGLWNIEDSNKLNEMLKDSSVKAQKIHDTFMKMAFERVVRRNVASNLNLLFHKHKNMWCSDKSAVLYNKSALKKSKYIFSRNMERFLLLLCDYYYYIIIILCLYSSFILLRSKDEKYIFFLLIFIGIASVHLVVEVASRYHYPVVISFAIIASNAIFHKNTKIKVNINNM